MTDRYEHDLSGELIKHVTAICGQRGIEWLDDLPSIVGELEVRWNVKADAPFEKGEFNFVAPVRSENGPNAVLKITPPYERIEIFSEAQFLRVRDGVGCVRLLAEDRDRFALLVECALPGESMDVCFANDPFACVDPAIEVLKNILLPPPDSFDDVQNLDDWFARFRRFRETDFPQDYGEKALAIYERLSSRQDKIFYIHGDFHPGNIVTADRAPYLAIDPKGLMGHVSYDIAVFLNNLHWWQKGTPGVEDRLHRALKIFAKAFDMSERDLREAAYAYMVIGAWWNFEDIPEHYDNEVALADIWDV
jgi:streptomycin 6-kinase